MLRVPLEIRGEIEEVLYRYCRGVDRADWELVRTCYHPDAHEDHRPYQGDLDGFIVFAREATKPMLMMAHCITNIHLEQVSSSVVWSEAYATCYHRFAGPDGSLQDMTVGVRYLDRFEHRSELWLIVDRTVVFDWSRIDPVAAQMPNDSAAPMGIRTFDDPSFGPFTAGG